MLKVHEFLIVYLVGGLTFVPLLLYIAFKITWTSSARAKPSTTFEKGKPSKQISEKSGWIRLSSSYKPKGSESNMAVLMAGIQSYVQGSKRQKGLVYAQLKCNALFIYESNPEDQEQQTDCKLIIPVHNYTISLYREKNGEQDVFGKETSIHLSPKTNLNTDSTKLEIHDGDRLDSYPSTFNTNEFYINCSRPIDKEDWYFGLLVAKDMMEESPNVAHVEMMDKTHFCMPAIEKLIVAIHKDEDYRQVQWLNAILGRIFLGLYKTDEIKEYLQDKILKKIKNVKLPSFLGEIEVQSIAIGDSIPLVTKPKLLSLTPEGDLLAEATVDYTGGLGVVIQTDFNFSYSSLMKPIRVPLVLSVTLKSMAGKLLLKVKPPPTNRFWVGFYQMPQMEWEVAPIVSDKQIRFSMVTNAIQSKIREFIAENIVLPNMDDFPFFSCTGQGGVFGTRVPKPSSPETQQQQEILLKQGDSIQNTVKSDDTTSMTDDATKKKKMVDAAKALERDEYSNASLQPHSLSACGTESINVDEPEIINCQIHHFSTPNPFSPGINHLGARGYSSLELSESYQSKPFNLSNELLNDQTVLIDDSILSSPSFSSNQISSDLSENIGLRKRHLSRGSSLESSLAEEQLKRNHSYHDSESKLQIDSQEPVTISMASHFSENDLYTFTRDSLDLNGREKNMSSTCSSLSSTCSTTTATSKTTTMGFGKSSLFFKFRNSNNNAKQHERKSDTRKSIFLNTKKDEFYSLANSIFKKTKNLRKEGDENGKGRLEGQTQLKISSFPPPLPPPRKSNNPAVQTTLVGSDNCFLSDERISTDEYKPPPVVSKLNVSDNDEPNLLEPFILSSSSPPPYHERIANFSFA